MNHVWDGILIVLACVGVARAEPNGGQAPRTARESPTRYCALHCVHAAAAVLGRPFSFEAIVEEKYLTTAGGSTVGDVCRATRDVGLYPTAYAHFTVDHLRLVDRPVILHVRPPGQTKFRHWVLFLGWERDGRIRVYDPPRETGNLGVAELLSLWDGVAIAVSRPDSKGPSAVFSLPCSLTSVALVLVAVLGLGCAPKSLSGWRLITAISAVTSLVGQLALPSAFWRSPPAVANVTAAFFEKEVPHVGYERLSELIGTSDCSLVDARLSNAYHDFHLPNAVHVPVDSGYLRLRREIAALEQSKNVLVYCQRKDCGWADAIAGQLSARGLQNVFVYEGGVNEWREKEGSDDASER